MSFNSLVFAVFLAAVLLGHRLLPWRAGRVFLVAASYVFYGFGEPVYVLLLLASTLVDFFAARGIHGARSPRRARLLLAASIVANLGLLGVFKYGDFAVTNVNAVLGWLGAAPLSHLGFALPVGISFYTFQTMSYSIDVYRGKTRPTTDLVGFALYVAYFPQLMAGPIERADSLLPQLQRPPVVSRSDLESGFQRVLWGLVKKVVFADRLAVFVDAVYAGAEPPGGLGWLLATACFALQIYLDFSGYADVAIGVARMMGVRLRENFAWPMLARNPVEFWSRWHISLSTWFRDYVLTALVGRRRPSPPRKLLNLAIVLGLMGLWHGAAWHFVAMGLWAGACIVLYEGAFLLLRRPRGRPLFGPHPLAAVLAVGLTTAHCLVLAAIFRAPDVGTAWNAVAGVFTLPWTAEPHHAFFGALAGFAYLVTLVRGLLHGSRRELTLPPPLRAAFWIGMLLLIAWGAVDTTEQYIYFQF